MTEPPDTTALAAHLRDGARRLTALAPAILGGEPWPLGEAFGTEPEASWGPPETLAHVAEMLPYWTGEMERVLSGRPQPVPFGRVATDALRIGLIERDRTLPASELLARVAWGAERMASRLESLTPDEAARRGVHPKLGEMTVSEIAERFATRHLDEHVEQLRSILADD